MKYIFKWFATDDCTYGYDCIIPFECDDLQDFILKCIENIQTSDYGCEVLGIYVEKDRIDNLEYCFYKLEEWFEQEKFGF